MQINFAPAPASLSPSSSVLPSLPSPPPPPPLSLSLPSPSCVSLLGFVSFLKSVAGTLISLVTSQPLPRGPLDSEI